MGPMSRAVCLCAGSSNQNKASTGAAIFMRGGLRLCRPARPGTFLVTLNHCLFTLSQELNELRLRAHPGKLWRPHPTLPPTPPPPQKLSIPYSLPQQQPPPVRVVYSHKRSLSPQTSARSMGECFSLYSLSLADTEAFVATSLQQRDTISCSREGLQIGPVSSCGFVQARQNRANKRAKGCTNI